MVRMMMIILKRISKSVKYYMLHFLDVVTPYMYVCMYVLADGLAAGHPSSPLDMVNNCFQF